MTRHDQATRATNPGAIADDVRTYHVDVGCTEAEFLAAARVYARAVVEAADLSVGVGDLEWQVSSRAKRRAGAVTHRDGVPLGVTLTWEYFTARGWAATAAVIRHELIHVHLLNEDGDPSHGPAFRRLAARLQTDRHCERFAAPAWWVICTECGTRLPRYRRSRLVTATERYACGACGGSLTVEPNE